MKSPFGDGTRSDKAIEAIKEFTTYRKGDAFGLTIFGSDVLHWVPVTKDLSDCPLVLTYDARQGWDMDNFVRFIELEVTRPNGTLVGRSWWKTRGGFGLNKFAPTEVKVARVVDDLLTCAPPCSRSNRVPSPSYPAIWNLYQ